MSCPVCSSQADRGRDEDYGEQQQFRCVRCGPFIITRTATAMLQSRLEKDPLAYARLSHAIRLQSNDEHLLSITSANLDDLIGERLPDIQQQCRNLLRWLVAQVGDDHLGHVTLPHDNSLAATIGAVDDDRVIRLLDYLSTQGLVSRSEDYESAYLTPAGWNQHETNNLKEDEPLKKKVKEEIEVSSVPEWDVFISHANEDKEVIARPLAERLIELGLRVWFDEFTLTVGDSLRRSIDHGLASSRFGVVVISPSFVGKEWPQKELDGLVAREIAGVKVILPVWHRITAEEIRKYSPLLSDRIAVSSGDGLEHVVAELMRAIKQ